MFTPSASATPRVGKSPYLFNDITTRRKFELERERFFAISSDFQVITGTDGYFKWVSPACERVL
ncbi:MAG TPA: hypothetical protein VM866_07950, partial [Pyrinomonadaceae bacterium]|nr:hypothetical protein [Pyrinomonadaceae bacterium]